MIFGNKDSGQNTPNGAPPPPWVNIDKSSTVKHSSSGPRFNLTAFVAAVTGFGTWGTRFFLFGLAMALMFLSYALYLRTEQRPPLPPDVDRPAVEIENPTTIINATTTLQ